MLRLQWRKYRSKYPWIQIIQTWRFWLLVVFTIMLMVYAITSLRRGPVTLLQQEIGEIWVGNIEYDFLTGLYFLKIGKDVFLRGSMPDHVEMNGRPTHCGKYNASRYMCANWYPKVKLEVDHSVEEHGTCQTLTWSAMYSDYKPKACFSMSDSNWYGGSLLTTQKWPLNQVNVPLQLYSTGNIETIQGDRNTFGNVLDYFWVNSFGVAVIVDSSTPIHVSINDGGEKLLCLHAMSTNTPVLKYNICKAQNLRKIHRFVINKFIHLPTSQPKDNLFEYPMWSTCPFYRNSLDQAILLKYSKDVMDKEMNRSVLDICDNEVSFLTEKNLDKFYNSHQSVMTVREYKFEPYLSISPFVQLSYKALDDSKLLLGPSGKPFVLNYNGHNVHIVNLLDPETYTWYVEKVKSIASEFNIEGFHMLSGEMNMLETSSIDASKIGITVDMEAFAKRFSTLSQNLKHQIITSSTVKSQLSSPIVMLTSKTASWGYDGGLRSVIPSVLTLGVLGYPYVIPNVVGGPGTYNATNAQESTLPDRSLYIRWAGLAAYMPAMMFSVPPWLYDDEAVAIVKQFTAVHTNTVAPLVVKAKREYEISGSPIIRPLWWNDPDDRQCQTIDDQYYLGDSLLVAPVLDSEQMARDIFIPMGMWKDSNTGTIYEGKQWLRGYKVELNQVATFVRQK